MDRCNEEVTLEDKPISTAQDEQLPPTIIMKHPLENTWTMWYFKNDKQSKEWVDNLKEVGILTLYFDI